MSTFVDTNVLVDVFGADPVWLDWSAQELEAAHAVGEVSIGPIVYAELSTRFSRRAHLDEALDRLEITALLELDRESLFLASKAHLRYRAQGGVRTQILPDFIIGAQAAVAKARLLTRDGARFQSYFPGLELIAP